MYNITVIPGDGIGPEVVEASKYVVDSTGININWEEVNAGASVLEEEGTALPDKLLKNIEKNRVALKGPVTTPVGSGFRSINVELRKKFNLYANVRPVTAIPGIFSRYPRMDLVIIRENTQDLYSGIEYSTDDSSAHAIKLVTREASERIGRFAFDYCGKNNRRKVTCVHKANILKLTDGLFLESVRNMAKDYPDIEYEELIVDNACMQVVIDPGRFDVLVMPNLYGDIMSDMCAGMVGGLGLVPGANMGDEIVIFEAVHGSAPDIAGRGIANPTAVILTSAMMLDYLGEERSAGIIRRAVYSVIKEGVWITPDLGGKATTMDMARAIAEYVNI
ncbi:MAG: Isocitrate dehydrogenase [NAD] [Firmicutes bacterium]|nr:Isocitrate dehydrogenase [NAD] [Bacillota bacterium]MDI6705321.1 isocitrate/isopropylmalate dehydrogenase family protein [Bacillota bacterium]